MRLKTAILIALFICIVQGRTIADDAVDSHQAQVQAATANAAAQLRDQLLGIHLTDDIQLSDFLNRTASGNDFAVLLQSAQPVGGARWVDAHTCQVRLEFPAAKLSTFLLAIARDPARHSPIKSDVMKAKLSSWTKTKFTVVGSSTGADSIDLAHPAAVSTKWNAISEPVRKAAILQARADAIHHVLDAIGSISLTDKMMAKEELARPAVAAHMNAWLRQQPVTRIEFLDDLNVAVTLSIAPRALVSELKLAVEADSVKLAPPQWDRIRIAIGALSAFAPGTASVNPPASQPAIVFPATAPDWIDQTLHADAAASGNGSRLKVSHAAQAHAESDIRNQFLALHLTPETTLKQAADSDPQIAQAIDRALLQTHLSTVEYRADGSVKVTVSLNLRDAWDELHANP